jgi:hypothetical protein
MTNFKAQMQNEAQSSRGEIYTFGFWYLIFNKSVSFFIWHLTNGRSGFSREDMQRKMSD